MVVKVYLSGMSGNKEVKKRQQRVLMILDSKCIKYDVIDITEPGKETDKDFMQNNATANGGTVSDPNPRSPLPPQLFNDDEYCGDYDLFDLANEVDTLEQFLKLEAPPEEVPQPDNDKETVNGLHEENGDVAKESKKNSQEKEIPETDKAENEKATEKEKTPVEGETTSREATPAKDGDEEAIKEKSPEKESSPEKEKSVERETPDKEPSPAKEAKKEASPAKEVEKEPSPAKEVEKEPSPAKEVEEKRVSKENTPEVESANENGSVSSRNQSEEKKVVETERKNNSSELLIESEQATE